MIDRDEAVGLPIRERAQEHGIDDAEDRRVRADPEPEREDHDGREGGTLDESAKGIAKIAHRAGGWSGS